MSKLKKVVFARFCMSKLYKAVFTKFFMSISEKALFAIIYHVRHDRTGGRQAAIPLHSFMVGLSLRVQEARLTA